MMRYSEISRELSNGTLGHAEFDNCSPSSQMDDCPINLTRDSSPLSDISTGSGPLVNPSPISSCRRHQHRRLSSKQRYNDDHYDNISLGNKNNLSGLYAGLRNSKRFSSSSSSSNVNGTANGAATIAYVRQRKDSTQSKQSFQIETESPIKHNITKSLNIKGSRRKNSIGCLNAFSASPDSPSNYYSVSGSPSLKSNSLPGHTSGNTSLDSTVLSALRIPADELANQLTLLDFPIFAAIQPDELTSCAWTKKDKHVTTPNIVAFTKRFNHTSFWVVQEILSGEQPKQRAEILAHFIKVAKKLHELNNLHSLFAIISGMQSASIYRLKKTWTHLAKKDKQSYERLSDIFSDQNNWENLRAYLESLRLPCIPYLGLFLTDLIYIDLAYPQKGGIEPESRRIRMNNILRVIANYQESKYTHIQPIEATRKYLTSIRYIEELQNIFEEEQYKKSLKLEPISPLVPSSSSCSSKESFNVDAVTPALACLSLSPAKTSASVRVANSSAVKFIPGHRKCRSLGTKFRSTSLPRNFSQKCHCSIIMLRKSGIVVNATATHKRCPCHYRIFGKSNFLNDAITAQNGACYDAHVHDHSVTSQQLQQRHLLDDSVLEQPQGAETPNGSIHINLSDNSDVMSCHLMEVKSLNMVAYEKNYSLQGCVRRKTVQKEGRKPAVASWQRYWLQIWANSLVYFPPKSFKGSERSDFKREPCKVCPLDGWFAQVIDNPKHKNTFELYHRTSGTIYKFRTDSPQTTQLWCSSICKFSLQHNRIQKTLPINLMSFE